MKRFITTAWGEACVIAAAGAIIGLAYAGAAHRGVFRSSVPTAQNSAPDTVSSTFLTFEEARRLYAGGHALFVDARHEYDFGQGHIKGAMSLPLQEFGAEQQLLKIIPKDTLLVTYCDGEECNSSVALASKLSSAGFTNVRVFFGGWNEWLSHKQPTEP